MRADVGRATNYVNLLANPGFEDGLSNWVTSGGAAAVKGTNPLAFDEDYYFSGGTAAIAFAEQPRPDFQLDPENSKLAQSTPICMSGIS